MMTQTDKKPMRLLGWNIVVSFVFRSMTVKSVLEDTNKFLEHLGLSEEPFGVYYADTKPEKAYGPKPGIPISRELEDQGKLNKPYLKDERVTSYQ
jgi:hypothetical protein